MNRTIKFRGFNRKDNKWFYGNLSQFDGGDCVINDIAVDPDTVGQFTGLLDKNGKEIYEGDVIKSPLGNVVSVGFGYKEHVITHGRPRFTDSFAAYGWIASNLETGITDFVDNSFLCGEVIGNIHDNELLNEK